MNALIVGGSPETPSPGLVRSLAAGAELVVACDAGVDACMRAGVVPHAVVGDCDSASAEGLAFARAGGAEFVVFPVEKDDVDLGLAIAYVRDWLAGQVPASGLARGASGRGAIVREVVDDAGRPDAAAADDMVQEAGYQTRPAHGVSQLGSEPVPITRPTAGVRLTFTGISGGRIDHALAAIGRVAGATDLGAVIQEDSFFAEPLIAGARPSWHASPDDVGRTLSVIALRDGTRVTERGMHWNLDDAELTLFDDLPVSNVVESPQAEILIHTGRALLVVQRRK